MNQEQFCDRFTQAYDSMAAKAISTDRDERQTAVDYFNGQIADPLAVTIANESDRLAWLLFQSDGQVNNISMQVSPAEAELVRELRLSTTHAFDTAREHALMDLVAGPEPDDLPAFKTPRRWLLRRVIQRAVNLELIESKQVPALTVKIHELLNRPEPIDLEQLLHLKRDTFGVSITQMMQPEAVAA